MCILVPFTANTYATESTTINFTNKTPLFDGHCKQNEWHGATKLQLPAQITLYLMHNKDSLFVCATGKDKDYTVIDLYIEDKKTGHLHNLHASAQLGERILVDKAWSESVFWNNKDWGGFWVPYAGEEKTDNGTRTLFLAGSDREIQVLRNKFTGNTWTMMIGISAVYQQGKYGAKFFYPSKANDSDKSTWAKFSFTQ